MIDSGEEGGLFRIGVATLTGVLAFLVLEKVLRLEVVFDQLHLAGVRDEQPGDELGTSGEGEQEDCRLPQPARQLH